jgi:hypothetical protein
MTAMGQTRGSTRTEQIVLVGWSVNPPGWKPETRIQTHTEEHKAPVSELYHSHIHRVRLIMQLRSLSRPWFPVARVNLAHTS